MCNFGLSNSYFFEDNVLKLIFSKKILNNMNTFALAKKKVVQNKSFLAVNFHNL